MQVTIEVAFELREKVRLVTDTEREVRLVTAWQKRVDGVRYELTCCTTATWHEGYEIEKLEPEEKKIGFVK